MSRPPEPGEHDRTRPAARRTPMDVVRDTAWRLATAALTGPSPEPRVRAARTSRKRSTGGRFVLILSALAAVAITVLLVVLLAIRPAQRSAEPEQVAGLPARSPSPAARSETATPATAAASQATRSPSPSPSARTTDVTPSPAPSRSPAAGNDVPPAALVASYTTTPYVAGLLGYRTEVTVTNPGTTARDGWVLTVSLPRSTLWISQVSGAAVTRQEAEWTFVPDATTRVIPAGQQVTVGFDVHGATLIDAAPAACHIDGSPCAG